ncbi:MAG: SusC/RagA family TonB-linked outer membrane protein [Alistipes sp.]|nr:SusC/RagA family TonB-linked outer membrane protein [Alistipes sp.]
MMCTLILTFAVGVFGMRAQGQSGRVTLHVADVPLEQVLGAIEKQTPYLFVYDTGVDASRRVSLDVDNVPLKSALDALFRSTDISYAIESSSVVLFRRNATGQSEGPVEVRGTVVDAAGRGMMGVAVVVKGTAAGTSTDADGNFVLQVPPPLSSAVLVAEYLGYESSETALNGRESLRIVLHESSIDVDTVVVTALGIKRAEKALSYNVQQVGGDKLVAVKDANFVNSLSGKVAGLNINSSSSGVGGASKVVMRGAKGIAQSSNALYVIDGIPMYNLAGEGSTEFGSSGSTEAIADINPEDIESISVLTGAAAAALYGSQASNGAIVITTKRGEAGHTSIMVSSNTELTVPFVMPRFQNRYGTLNLDTSWGARLNGSNSTGYDPRKDYMQTGIVGTETFTFSTGTDRNQTYVSASAVNSRGIIPNNGYERYNFTFRNTTSFFKERMLLDIGGSYIRQSDRNMTNQGIYSNPLVSAYLFPRGNDWDAVRMYERYDPSRKIYTQYWPQGWGTLRSQNPYWINYRNLRVNDKNRYMFNAGLSYDILPWLSASGRVRLDNTYTEYTEKYYASTEPTIAEGSENGYYGESNIRDRQIYCDALLDIHKRFGTDWSIQANVGAALSDTRKRSATSRGPIRADGLPNVFNVFQLDNATMHREQEGWREQYQSVFASAEIGWRGACYLTLTGRNDWPSQLAGPHSVSKSFFYPSVGVSVVVSELVGRMPEQLSYLKVRGSWASVGLPFARFLAYPTYEWDSSQNVWKPQSNYPMYELKPERTDSWEVGLTMRFLRHFSLDVSYYDTRTFNQTFDPQISASSGYSKFYVQTGSVRNHGVELSLGFDKTWNRIGWSSQFTMSSNRNEILELVDNYKHPVTGELITKERLDVGGLSQARFLLKKGGTLGDLYSTADIKYDSNGDIYVDENDDIGVEYKVGDIKLGSVFPKANLAWRNDIRLGDFNIGFLVTARLGGVVYSATQAYLDAFGVSETSAAARDAGGLIINGNDRISADKWFATVGGNGGLPQYYVYSATNVRLQEASVSYTIPRRKLGDIVEITLSLVGRNLWMIYNKAPFDPESVATTGDYYQGIDYFMMPSLRSVGFNLRLKF